MQILEPVIFGGFCPYLELKRTTDSEIRPFPKFFLQDRKTLSNVETQFLVGEIRVFLFLSQLHLAIR